MSSALSGSALWSINLFASRKRPVALLPLVFAKAELTPLEIGFINLFRPDSNTHSTFAVMSAAKKQKTSTQLEQLSAVTLVVAVRSCRCDSHQRARPDLAGVVSFTEWSSNGWQRSFLPFRLLRLSPSSPQRQHFLRLLGDACYPPLPTYTHPALH